MRSTALMAAALIAIACGGVAMAVEIPELTFQTPWKKLCSDGLEPDLKRFCGTGTELRKQDDNSMRAAVALLDGEGQEKKILRVVFPLGMQLVHGTRLIVHGQDPLQGPYAICTAAGCVADYETTPALLDSMATSEWVIVQAIDQSGKPLTETLALAGFWTAHQGSPGERIEPIMAPGKKPWLDDTLRPELRPRER